MNTFSHARRARARANLIRSLELEGRAGQLIAIDAFERAVHDSAIAGCSKVHCGGERMGAPREPFPRPRPDEAA